MERDIITLKNVSLSYDDIEVFKDISLTLERGAFYYITGESGVGKTSLLRLIYMDNLNYSGKIKLFEQNIKVMPRRDLPALRRKIGVVFQESNLLEHLSILQNVMIPLLIAGHRESVARQRAHKILTWIGLGDFMDVLPKQISGGQKQTAVLARALIANPVVLIADEPTGNLDLKNARRFMKIFEYLHQKGTTILMATHNQNLLKEFPHPELHLVHKRLEFINHSAPQIIPTVVEAPPSPVSAVVEPMRSKYSSFHKVAK